MISLREVEDQLKQIGCNYRFWGRAEVRELATVLMPGETITHATNGHYEGGFALLAATDQRLVMIDRKPMFLTIEAMSYDMIAEVNFNHRLINATLRVFTLNKALVFTSWNHHHLRAILIYTQQQISALRQQYSNPLARQVSEPTPVAVPQPAMYQMLQPAATAPGALPSTYSRLPLMTRRRKFLA